MKLKEILIARICGSRDFLKAWNYKLTSGNILRKNKNINPHSEYAQEFFSKYNLLIGSNFNINRFVEIFSEERQQQILNNADRILDHNFNIFSKVEINAGSNINWQKDYLSGKEYPLRYYRNMRIVNPATPDDPKIPWELSRFHHGLRLAQAYALSGQKKYAEGFLGLFLDWLAKNPWKFGVNWTCAMEVAIRACNWITAFEILRESPILNKLSEKLLKRVFQQHLDFILENLEWSEEVTTNHYISDLLGLIIICAFFPNLKKVSEVEDFAFGELEKEILKQFYDDGGNWESSTTYQRFVTEMMFYAALVAQQRGKNLSDEFHQRLKNSVRLLNSLANIEGRIPQLGDNDSGRFLPLKERDDTDIRHLGALVGILDGDSALIETQWGFPEEAYWIWGDEGYNRYRSLIGHKHSKNTISAAFESSGLFVMRSKDAQMVISGMPNGQNWKGGHCHNDKLSFTLSIGNQEIITDPGTFIYSGNVNLRREFRSTRSHNTIVVDNEEQNRYIKNAIFWVHPDAKVRELEWRSDSAYDVFIGEHTGYARLEGEVIHRRSIAFNKKDIAWVIVDDVFENQPTGGERNICISFHLATRDVEDYMLEPPSGLFKKLLEHLNRFPLINAAKNKGFIVRTPYGNLCGVTYSSSNIEQSFENCWISDSYLSRYESRVVRHFSNVNLPLKIMAFLWLDKKEY